MDSLPFSRIFRCTAIEVKGNSMLPTYRQGDWLLVGTVGSTERLQDSVVVIERESYPGILYIKRVIRIDLFPTGALGLWVQGDNEEQSTDSRQWGPVSLSEIRGKVWFRYKRARR
jgi:signal peptidase I